MRARISTARMAVASRQLARSGASVGAIATSYRRYLDPHRDAPAPLFDGLHPARATENAA